MARRNGACARNGQTPCYAAKPAREVEQGAGGKIDGFSASAKVLIGGRRAPEKASPPCSPSFQPAAFSSARCRFCSLLASLNGSLRTPGGAAATSATP